MKLYRVRDTSTREVLPPSLQPISRRRGWSPWAVREKARAQRRKDTFVVEIGVPAGIVWAVKESRQ